MTGEQLSIVHDFDGALTDAFAEATGFEQSYVDFAAQTIGVNRYELAERILLEKERIAQTPGIFGWENNGIIVAPATVDPYIFLTVSMQNILKEDPSLLPNQIGISELLQQFYGHAYPSSGTVFREGAKEYLTALHTHAKLTVVTNSERQKVSEKIDVLLGVDHGITVVGNAKKYVADPHWEHETIPLFTTKPGFPRPIFLGRKHYNTVLDSMPHIDMVIGDIYELDLALPEQKGIRTVLVTSDHTPAWEKDYYQHHQNGFASPTLAEIQEHVLFTR